MNYGGIGAVIGHEIGHGFDDQGSHLRRRRSAARLVDRQGSEAFEERTKALIDQYNVLKPAQAPGHRVNGQLTIGENIGDLGGLSIASRPTRSHTTEAPSPSWTAIPLSSGCS